MSSEASPSWARTPDTRGAYPPSAKQHPRSIGPEKSQARDFDQAARQVDWITFVASVTVFMHISSHVFMHHL